MKHEIARNERRKNAKFWINRTSMLLQKGKITAADCKPVGYPIKGEFDATKK